MAINKIFKRFNGSTWEEYKFAAYDSERLGGVLPSGYALANHTHTISQITNLQTTLDGKLDENNPTFTGTMTGSTIKAPNAGTLTLQAGDGPRLRIYDDVSVGTQWELTYGDQASPLRGYFTGAANLLYVDGARIKELGSPADGGDATNKTYVDNAISGIGIGSSTSLGGYTSTGTKTLSAMANYDLIYVSLTLTSNEGEVYAGGFVPSGIGRVSASLYDTSNMASSIINVQRTGSTTLVISEFQMPISFQSGGGFSVSVYGINIG